MEEPIKTSDWRVRPFEARDAVLRTWSAALRLAARSQRTWLQLARDVAWFFLGFFAAAILWLYFLDWNSVRGPVARYASIRLGQQVQIAGNLNVQLFSPTPRISAAGVTIANPDWVVGRPLAVDIGHLTFTFRLLPYLLGNTVLPLVQIDRPKILVIRDADGRTNWDFISTRSGWNLPPIQRFLVRDGQITIEDRLRKLMFTGAVSSHENAGVGMGSFQLAGLGTLNGEKFSAELQSAPLVNVDTSKPYDFSFDLHSGATSVAAAGTIVRPFHLGRFSARTIFAGSNLSDLYLLTGLALPQSAPYRLEGDLTRDGTLYRFKDFHGIVGRSDLHGTLYLETANRRALLNGAIDSKVLEFKDLGLLFGSKSKIATAYGRLLPDIPLHVERLRQMDAEVDYDVDLVRSREIPLRDLHTHVSLNDGVFVLKPLSVRFRRGRLNGILRVDARGAIPAADATARISELRLEQFVKGSPPPLEGVLEAYAMLHGFGDNVHAVASTASGTATVVVPQGKFRKAFAELTGINLLNALGLLLANDKSHTRLRCALAHFTVSAGALQTERFVFDTDPVRVEGKGRIDLKNETINLQVQGKPKTLRIGRVRAPLLITGSLASPRIDVKAQDALLQGGLATALGVLFPPAAILPFVDPGLAKDANCTGLLRRSNVHLAHMKRAS